MNGIVVSITLGVSCVAALVALVYVLDDNKGPNSTSRSDSLFSSTSQQQQLPPIMKSVPELPAWARMTVTARVENRLAYCAKVVQDTNAESKKLDVVMWGDSITEFMRLDHLHVWKAYFSNVQSALLGVGGTSIEELTWRMIEKERLTTSPRCIIIMNGIINLKNGRKNPAEYMDFLIGWVRAAMPSTQVVLMALLPNSNVTVAPTNAKYKEIAQKHGVTFAECGMDLNPNDKNHFRDGTHPTAGGYDNMLRCLKPIVTKLLN